MVVLLWAGCGFCQAQTEKLQQMHYELSAINVDVDFIIVDRSAENPPIEQLTNRCDFPIFQDEAAIDAWDEVFENAVTIIKIKVVFPSPLQRPCIYSCFILKDGKSTSIR